jgi:uncharacterized protein YndB with AHSA1/START domain
MDARLGGRVWAGREQGRTHGTIRAFDPPERLEIGSVLVPGAYAGSITMTVERTSLGSEVRVEQMARGRIDATVEERISTGWTELLARLTDLAER